MKLIHLYSRFPCAAFQQERGKKAKFSLAKGSWLRVKEWRVDSSLATRFVV